MKIILIIKLLLISTLLQSQDIEYTLFNSSNGFVDDQVSGLFVDSHNRLWIGTYNNGIYTYYEEEFLHFDEDEYNLISGRAKAFVEDSLGNIWIGFYDTSQGGVMMYDGTEFIPKHTPSDSVSIGRVLDLEINELTNELLIYEAPNNYNAATLNIIHEDSISVFTLGYTTNYIIDDDGDILVTDGGEIYVTGRLDGLYRLEENTLLEHLGPYEDAYTGNLIGYYDLLKDNESNLWIGMEWDGMIITNEAEDYWTAMYMIDSEEELQNGVLPGFRLRDINKNQAGDVWFSTTDFYHNIYGSISNMYINTFRDEELISIQVVNTEYIDDLQGNIAVDNQDNIWIVLEEQLMRVHYEEAIVEDTTVTNPQDSITTNLMIEKTQVEVYPNPANQHFYIKANDVQEYHLFDVNGRLVLSGEEKWVTSTQLPNGLYYLKLFTDDQIIYKNILIQH